MFETDEIERLLVKSLIVDAFERNFVRDIHLQGVTVLMKNDLEFYVNEDIEREEIFILHESFIQRNQFHWQNGTTNIFVMRRGLENDWPLQGRENINGISCNSRFRAHLSH